MGARMRTALASAVMLFTVASAALATPSGFTADYAISAAGVTIGATRWQLRREGPAGYQFTAHSEARGLLALVRNDVIDERSSGEFDDLLRPRSYHYRRQGRKPREVTIHFDWPNRRAAITTGAGRWRLKLPPGTVDKLGYVLVLMRDLAAGQRTPGYDIADGGKLKRYQFRVDGEETLDTRLGTLRTLRVRRQRMTRRATTMWSAPALDYLPVLIEHREKDGNVVRIELTAVEGIPARR